MPGNTYLLETLEGQEFPKVLNGKYLKKYNPSVWIGVPTRITKAGVGPPSHTHLASIELMSPPSS